MARLSPDCKRVIWGGLMAEIKTLRPYTAESSIDNDSGRWFRASFCVASYAVQSGENEGVKFLDAAQRTLKAPTTCGRHIRMDR